MLEDLYRLIDPESGTTPFRTRALRWRNFVIVILLLHVGLRRGELLCLAVDAVNDEADLRTGRSRFWLNVLEDPYEEDDPVPWSEWWMTSTGWRFPHHDCHSSPELEQYCAQNPGLDVQIRERPWTSPLWNMP